MKKQPHSSVKVSVQVLHSTLHLLGRSILLSSRRTSEWHHDRCHKDSCIVCRWLQLSTAVQH